MNSCAICGSHESEYVLSTRVDQTSIPNRTLSLLRCTNCGLFYLVPTPKRQEIVDSYGGDYYLEYYSEKKSPLAKLYYSVLGSEAADEINRIKQGGTILDIGCGSGDFLKDMRERGWNVYGIDISSRAIELTSKKVDGVLLALDLYECEFPDKSFDVITLWHSLEHIDSPVRLMHEVNRILKDDGLLVIEVPNMSNPIFRLTTEGYFALEIPRHIFGYSRDTIQMLLERSGFKLKRTTYPAFKYPLSIFASFSCKLHQSTMLSKRSVNTIVALLSPLLATFTLANRLLSTFFPFGEILRVYAQKS